MRLAYEGLEADVCNNESGERIHFAGSLCGCDLRKEDLSPMKTTSHRIGIA